MTGSFDRVTGTYAFQGRRFDVVETSSINFRGDLNPEVYVTVRRRHLRRRDARGIFGPLHQPELHLASTPPLDDSDILSLIVFNTSSNELSSAAATGTAGARRHPGGRFHRDTVLSARSRIELGLEILEIEAVGEFGGGPKVTIGRGNRPGSGGALQPPVRAGAYDEATIEYYLSRILRLRATFSDAQTLISRSPFRRVERAGIDLLLFFSF